AGVPAFATGVNYANQGYRAVWNNSLYSCESVPNFCTVGDGHNPGSYGWAKVADCGTAAPSSSSKKVSSSSSSKKTSSSSSSKKTSSSSSSKKASSSSAGGESTTWNRANLTWYTSWPEPGSEEWEDYNGGTWCGYFAGVDGQKSEEWVSQHNIIAIHEKDWSKYKLKTFRLKQNGYTIDAQVLDKCADSDCSGCCTRNANANNIGFLIDIESYTKARFHNQGSGIVEWQCIDCD
ncbi:MAG: hypothetical protein J6Z50_06460, partial [Fibrobacterales bacterium]|nr:hypothetical protein [Fibrobacterales bacterium]